MPHPDKVAFAKRLRRRMTKAELCLWYHLRANRFEGYKFKRQQVIGPFIVDFVCFKERLIIEIDGGQHTERTDYDRSRSEYLEFQGYEIIRFWNNDVLGNTSSVMETIQRKLHKET